MNRLYTIFIQLLAILFTISSASAQEPTVVYPHEVPLLDRTANSQRTTPTESAPAKSMPQMTAYARNDQYKIQAGDTLRINVWKETELDREVLVMPDGTVNFPLIGTFVAAGFSTAEVQRLVTAQLQPFVPAAAVTVVVKEAAGNFVNVIGQVTKPGEVLMTRALTVMQALSQAGGLTPYADDDDIVVLRKINGKETSIAFDYSDIARGKNLETNITLQPGDVIVVPTQSLF